MPLELRDRLNETIRIVQDFPKQGISFKDITPIFLHPFTVRACVITLADRFRDLGITKVIGIDSRGFLLGPMIAQELNVGFVLVRKKGKLPHDTVEQTYELEYGSATVEVHKADLLPTDVVLIHDDLLATGGTANAAALLAEQIGAKVAGFSFIVGLPFLNGAKILERHSQNIATLIDYND